MGNGVAVNFDSLPGLGGHLRDIASTFTGTSSNFHIETPPNFGQGNGLFTEANLLAGKYRTHATSMQGGMTALVQAINVLAQGLDILAKNYKTLEAAGTTDADAIRAALTEAGTAAATAGLGQPGADTTSA